MAELSAEQLKTVFEMDYLPGRDHFWLDWRQNYLEFITEVERKNQREFWQPGFQRRLWDDNPISSVGPGNSVSVESVYTDERIIHQLWELKHGEFAPSPMERGRALQQEFDRLIETVANSHSASGRHPRAKLIRVFAALRPYDVMCIVSTPWLKLLHKALSTRVGPYRKNIIYLHVQTLDFLFSALDSEKSLPATVDINQFSWWLAKREQERQDEGVTSRVQQGEYQIATDRPSLSILAPEAQRKGLFYVTDNIPLLQTIVEAASDGATREELRELILSTSPKLSASSANNVLNQAKALGLLRLENQIYYLTPLGEDLRDGEPPHQVLFPNLVRRFFGFAHILAIVRDANWEISKASLLAKMRSTYPSWTTDFAPSQLTTWMVQLGLFAYERQDRDSPLVVATDDGMYWASGLPSDMSPWYVDADSEDGDLDDEGLIEEARSAPFTDFAKPRFDDLVKHFSAEKLILPKRFLQRLHSALHSMGTKRFVLLTGLSGTGKTSIARAYAAAYCKASNVTGSHYCEIPVWPDWTDPTSLLGFVNPLHEEPKYQMTEALEFIRRASQTPEKPFFLCLDEMNLARIEHYFAPFLSAMEGRPGKQFLKLHPFEGLIDNVEPKIAWPRNLFIFGTVNMDETTHPFSDKVLDRAFPFELWEVNKDAWLSAKRQDDAIPERAVDVVFPVLDALYDALRPVRRHFGYRVFDEVLQFYLAWPEQSDPNNVILDAAVHAKVLPKIRGEQTESLTAALENVESICTEHELSECAVRVISMRAELSSLGFVKFWS